MFDVARDHDAIDDEKPSGRVIQFSRYLGYAIPRTAMVAVVSLSASAAYAGHGTPSRLSRGHRAPHPRPAVRAAPSRAVHPSRSKRAQVRGAPRRERLDVLTKLGMWGVDLDRMHGEGRASETGTGDEESSPRRLRTRLHRQSSLQNVDATTSSSPRSPPPPPPRVRPSLRRRRTRSPRRRASRPCCPARRRRCGRPSARRRGRTRARASSPRARPPRRSGWTGFARPSGSSRTNSRAWTPPRAWTRRPRSPSGR